MGFISPNVKKGIGIGGLGGEMIGGPGGALTGAAAGAGVGGIANAGDNAQDAFKAQLDQFNPGARPDNPIYSNQIDPNTGLLSSQYQLGNSDEWKKQALGQQAEEQTGAYDLASKLGSTQAAQAQANLASHGGLRGGAAERTAMAGARSTADQQQNATRAGALQRAGIGVQGENLNRESQKYNIGNALAEKQRQDELKKDSYSQQMQQWAATNQARATLQAGQNKGQSGGVGGGIAKTVGK